MKAADSEDIPRDFVQNCLNDPDLEVQDALFGFFGERGRFERISPPISEEILDNHYKQFLRRTIVEDPQGANALSRYSALLDLCEWFRGAWDAKAPMTFFEGLKAMIGDLYLNGGADVKEAIITGCLEHLFESNSIERFFSDWEANPSFSSAFAMAHEWGAAHRSE